MSDASKVSQIPGILPGASTRGDEARGAQGSQADPATTPFSAVLKAKTDENATAGEPVAGQDNPANVAAQSIVTATEPALVLPALAPAVDPAAAPRGLLSRLESDLTSALPAQVQSPGDATAVVIELPAQADVRQHPKPSSDDLPVTIEPDALATAAALPVIAAPVPAVAAAMPAVIATTSAAASASSREITVPPAPTSAPVSAPSRSGESEVGMGSQGGHGAQDGGAAAQRQPSGKELAATPAKSAEAAGLKGDPLPVTPAGQAGSNEFRPLLERMTDQANLIATSQSVPQGIAPRAAEPAIVQVATPFNRAGWAQEIEQSITWVVKSTHQEADLVLNPPQLGRIEVSIVVEGNQVNASFAAANPGVREALEASLPRLRETLAEAGVNLGQTHVGRDSSRDAPFFGSGDDRRRDGAQTFHGTVGVQSPLLSVGASWQASNSRSMVDVFA